MRSELLNTLLITLGLDVVFTYLAQLAFSADFRTINPSYAGANLTFGGLVIPFVRFAAFGIAVALAGALWWLLVNCAGARDTCNVSKSRRSTAL